MWYCFRLRSERKLNYFKWLLEEKNLCDVFNLGSFSMGSGTFGNPPSFPKLEFDLVHDKLRFKFRPLGVGALASRRLSPTQNCPKRGIFVKGTTCMPEVPLVLSFFVNSEWFPVLGFMRLKWLFKYPLFHCMSDRLESAYPGLWSMQRGNFQKIKRVTP